MRPPSPLPITTVTRHHRMFSHDDLMTGDSSRSSSLPPRARVSFSGINTLAPCSNEFQKSLNDLHRMEEDSNFTENKLTLPVIQLLKCSENDHSHRKTRSNCWDDDSGAGTSDDDNTKSWTSLSNAGTLVTLEPKKRNRFKAKSEQLEVEACDDNISVRSDSYMICNTSPSVRRRARQSMKHEGGIKERLSRKDESKRGQKTSLDLEPSMWKNGSRGLSPLSRTQQNKDNPVCLPINRSKSAHTSPQRESREIYQPSNNSAPNSPYGSPLLNRANNGKGVPNIPKWRKPFSLSTSPPSSSLTNQNINPILVKIDPMSGSSRRVNKDNSRSFRLSDLTIESATKGRHVTVNLEEEFKRLKACRYLRCQSDGKGSNEDVFA
ncbi:uncharacterized protein LOC129271697 [Lytechinus pictus]|uniref:uncharacterized protein LOC129271697 n=1 Tax=Lytechinus pictus TaxID=7653 RepID=UPI0030BA201B